MPAKTSPSTIVLKGEEKNYDEGRVTTAVTIKPGMLCERVAAGTYSPHGTAGGWAEAFIAKEDAIIGKTINDAYAAGDLLRFHKCQKGDEVLVICPTSLTLTPAVYLTSNGDGKMKIGASTDIRLFKCLDTVTTVADTFVRARCL